jgi:hypothetical protein
VLSLAQAAYDQRILPSGRLDNTRLGILADALEEAGGNPDIFGHLREPGPHVRGCFVVDALLAKEEAGGSQAGKALPPSSAGV